MVLFRWMHFDVESQLHGIDDAGPTIPQSEMRGIFLHFWTVWLGFSGCLLKLVCEPLQLIHWVHACLLDRLNIW
jgi:hypothetical protein